MDTTYFDKKKIREKAIDVDEKDLFGLYYDYDSAFEHGLWGAISGTARRTLFIRKAFKSGANFGTAFAHNWTKSLVETGCSRSYTFSSWLSFHPK